MASEVTSAAHDAARALALRLLARRALSERELQQRLVRRGISVDVATTIVEAMVARRYTDDGAIFDALIAQAQREGRGPLWVTQRARLRGLWNTACAQRLEEARPELEDALPALLRRRLDMRAPAQVPDAALRRRVAAALCRRGFSPASVARAWPRQHTGPTVACHADPFPLDVDNHDDDSTLQELS